MSVKSSKLAEPVWVLLIVRPDGQAKVGLRKSQQAAQDLLAELEPMMAPTGVQFKLGPVPRDQVEFLLNSGTLYSEAGMGQTDGIFNIHPDKASAFKFVN